MRDSVSRWKWALFSVLFVSGLGFSSWVVRTPEIKSSLDASLSEMGLILFSMSLGSMVGLLCAARIIHVLDGRGAIWSGTAASGIGLVSIGVGSELGLVALVASGLALVGGGFGIGEVAVNVEGSLIEATLSRSVLPAVHGMFSLGLLCGAVAGVLIEPIGVSVTAHLVVVGVIVVAVTSVAAQSIPRGSQAQAGVSYRRQGFPRWWAVWRERRFALLGGLLLALAFAEGAASDWMPIIMTEIHQASAAEASLAYAFLVGAMAVTRLVGGRLVDRWGASHVIRVGALVAIVGIVCLGVSTELFVTIAGCVLWGMGVALGFPLVISAAARLGDSAGAANRVTSVAAIGYLAFLVGPPLLGFVGQVGGMRWSLIVVALILGVAAVFAQVLAPPRSTAARAVEQPQ